MEENKDEDTPKPERIKIKGPIDLQRLKLEKLMKNPDKPVIIPERPKPKTSFPVPEFVRNVTGSSAGAGSGEFHVYRHLRRKEYARQKFIERKSEHERLNDEYQAKLDENRRVAEERTAKKRAKRLKKKKNKRVKKGKEREATKESSEESEDDEDESEDVKDTEVKDGKSEVGNENQTEVETNVGASEIE